MNNLPERLRKAAEEIRRKSYPPSDLIPLLQEAADALYENTYEAAAKRYETDESA